VRPAAAQRTTTIAIDFYVSSAILGICWVEADTSTWSEVKALYR
jgi:hypothetical protein